MRTFLILSILLASASCERSDTYTETGGLVSLKWGEIKEIEFNGEKVRSLSICSDLAGRDDVYFDVSYVPGCTVERLKARMLR